MFRLATLLVCLASAASLQAQPASGDLFFDGDASRELLPLGLVVEPGPALAGADSARSVVLADWLHSRAGARAFVAMADGQAAEGGADRLDLFRSETGRVRRASYRDAALDADGLDAEASLTHVFDEDGRTAALVWVAVVRPTCDGSYVRAVEVVVVGADGRLLSKRSSPSRERAEAGGCDVPAIAGPSARAFPSVEALRAGYGLPDLASLDWQSGPPPAAPPR